MYSFMRLDSYSAHSRFIVFRTLKRKKKCFLLEARLSKSCIEVAKGPTKQFYSKNHFCICFECKHLHFTLSCIQIIISHYHYAIIIDLASHRNVISQWSVNQRLQLSLTPFSILTHFFSAILPAAILYRTTRLQTFEIFTIIIYIGF